MKCAAFLGGEVKYKPHISEGTYVICADSGYFHAKRFGIKPDIVLGDFDSAEIKDIECDNIKTYPAKKNYTDGEIAVMYAKEIGAESITIYGALGGRIDHELGNLHLLYLSHSLGIDSVIEDGKKRIYYTESEITLTGDIGDIVSVIPIIAPEGITLQGLEYKLTNEPLACTGVSNIMTENTAHIALNGGRVLVIHIGDENK